MLDARGRDAPEGRVIYPYADPAYFTGAIRCWYGVPAHMT